MLSSVLSLRSLRSSSSDISFLAVTGHYVDKEDQLRSKVLDCYSVNGSHTAELIRGELEDVFESFNVTSKVLAGTTDNGTNVVKLIKDMDSRRLACYAHSLNLVVMDSLKACDNLKKVRTRRQGLLPWSRQH